MPEWITAWAQAQADFSVICGKAKNHTVKAEITNEVSGSAVRLRFHNKESKKEVHLRRVSLAFDSGDPEQVAFGGAREITLQPGEWICSDPVEYPLSRGNRFTVSMAFRGAAASGNQLPVPVQYSREGDYTMYNEMPAAPPTFVEKKYQMNKVLPVLSGIEVLTENKPEVLICFGDSITQQSHWTAPLQKMLTDAGKNTVVINKGIGGNCLLTDHKRGFMALWGPAAVERFDSDVLEVAGATGVLFALGTNDIGMTRRRKALPDAQLLFDTMVSLASRAKAQGMRVYIATITARGNSGGYQDWHEAQRLELNRLIRESTAFDGVIDFDAVTKDPQNAFLMDRECDSGDHLHPGPVGGARMAEEAYRILIHNGCWKEKEI